MTAEKNRQILLASRRAASLAQTTSNWSKPLFVINTNEGETHG